MVFFIFYPGNIDWFLSNCLLNSFIPMDQYRYVFSHLIRIYTVCQLLILTETSICNNECVLIQRRKSPCQKSWGERVEKWNISPCYVDKLIKIFQNVIRKKSLPIMLHINKQCCQSSDIFPTSDVTVRTAEREPMRRIYQWNRRGHISLAICDNSTTGTLFTLTLVLLVPDMPCLCKQCRSRSVGFFRSQLIWICTVYQSVCEFVSTTWIK